MVTAEAIGTLGSAMTFSHHEVLGLITDWNITCVTDANVAKPGSVFTERGQMRGPESKAFRSKRRACAGASGSIVGNADHREVGIGGYVIWLVQVSPKSMSGGRIHAFSFSRYCIACTPLKQKRTAMFHRCSFA
jgi:hypothetical protein